MEVTDDRLRKRLKGERPTPADAYRARLRADIRRRERWLLAPQTQRQLAFWLSVGGTLLMVVALLVILG